MSTRIISTSLGIDGETLEVQVEFSLANGDVVTRDVPVFQPQTKADVLAAPALREQSELRKARAAAVNAAIKAELDAGIKAAEKTR